ncbi:MAG: methyltransferase, partial [Longimicrobiales bacterium]|nr:methyltransferase [Longimicrobiales bacterium]
DLTPAGEQPRPGLLGRLLGFLMRRFTRGRDFVPGHPDREAIEAALRAAGLAWSRWSRMDAADGTEGTPLPPEGPFRSALIRLPPAREAFDFALAAVVGVLAPGGRVLVYGAGDEGIGSTGRHMVGPLDDVGVRAVGQRCRVLEGRVPVGAEVGSGAGARGEARVLARWRAVAPMDLGWGEVPWVRYPGAFGRSGVDAGTRLLLEHLPGLPPGAVFLDFGAGTGVLAAALRHRCPGARAVLVEPDALARAAARENVPGAEFAPLGSWSGAGPFDAVVANPPYHRGKAETLDPVRALVAGSAAALAPGGELRLVVQRRHPVEALLRASFAEVARLADHGPYRVWRATKAPAAPAGAAGAA